MKSLTFIETLMEINIILFQYQKTEAGIVGLLEFFRIVLHPQIPDDHARIPPTWRQTISFELSCSYSSAFFFSHSLCVKGRVHFIACFQSRLGRGSDTSVTT